MREQRPFVNIHWSLQQGVTKRRAFAAHPLFALAFRPFFLGGACWAFVAISLWVLWLSGYLSLQPGFPAVLWHAHEMLFGFGAVIAVGFLLTAAQNWTGLASCSGNPLLLLAMLWLTARTSLLFAAYPSLFWLFASAQLLWWIGAIVSLANLLIRAKSSNNYVFIALLSVMALVNTAFIYASKTQQFALASHLSHGMILMFCLLMGIVGGRVIPFFTAKALAQVQVKTLLLDTLLLPLSVIGTALFLTGFFLQLPLNPGWFMLLVGALHLSRQCFWQPWQTRKVPLLWSLQLAYFAMGLGLILLGISNLTHMLVFKDVLHLLSISAMAGLILAMMARVSLGHTGRTLHVGKAMSVAFALLLVAGPIRMFASLSGAPLLLWQFSAWLWLGAFAVFLWFYLPILTQPRADGRPG